MVPPEKELVLRPRARPCGLDDARLRPAGGC